MQLATWVRASIWRTADWRSALAKLADALIADPADASQASRALDLARAFELVEPDRRSALAMYLLAWRAGTIDAVEPARLAREVGDHSVFVEIALADFRVTNDPKHLVSAGMTWVDAGRLDLALEPLTQASAKLPMNQEVKAMLAVVRGEIRDPHREVARWMSLASAGRANQSSAYLHAARIARALKLDDIYGNILQTAINQNLGGAFILLVQDRLISRGNEEELRAFYRAEFEAVTTDRDYVERVRAAATKLVLRWLLPGLALRLLRSSLEHSYSAKLTDVSGHIASWELLLAHARQTKSTVDIMPLIVEALGQTLSDDERVYLSRTGFDVAWRDARDVEAARPYATAVAELVPDHPEVCAFMSKELAAMLRDNEDDLLAVIANFGEETRPYDDFVVWARPPAVEGAPLPSSPASAELATSVDALPVDARPVDAPSSASAELAPPVDAPAVDARPVDAPSPASAELAPPVDASLPPSPASAELAPPVDASLPPSPASAELAPPVDAPAVDARPVDAPLPPSSASAEPAIPEPGPVVREPPTAPSSSDGTESSAATISPAARALLGGGRQVGLPAKPSFPTSGPVRPVRIVIPIDVELSVEGGAAFTAVARDISATGLFVATQTELALGTNITLELHLPGVDVFAQSRHQVSARVMRRAKAGYGVMLLDPSPELIAAISALASA